jgi:hypothetical protein
MVYGFCIKAISYASTIRSNALIGKKSARGAKIYFPWQAYSLVKLVHFASIHVISPVLTKGWNLN